MLLRTHNCGQLRKEDIGKIVQLCGWVKTYRDHGGVVFIDLRDREGITQVLFDPTDDAEMHKLARALRNEWVISVAGKVRSRPEGMENPKMATGAIEIVSLRLVVLNKADTVPFEPDTSEKVSEEMRLKYRYVDTRRAEMANALIMRHRIAKCVRDYYDKQGFLEIETPFLTKSTPEGAGFPGPQPHATGHVLCAAAKSAAFQADPHGRRHGQVHADRPLLPR